jgi:hypothetical protein
MSVLPKLRMTSHMNTLYADRFSRIEYLGLQEDTEVLMSDSGVAGTNTF